MRRRLLRILPLSLSAVLFALMSALAISVPGSASAATGCHVTVHRTVVDGVNTYNLYKYECNGNQTYGYMTGNPGNACITMSLGNVTDGACYGIPVGYTPPRTSITTPTRNAGSTIKLVDICFINHLGVPQGGCHNDFG